jgi:cysteine sulfinate desulfinase/cysteine desulfurase-like protein
MWSKKGFFLFTSHCSSCIRFSLSGDHTVEEVDTVLKALPQLVEGLRH